MQGLQAEGDDTGPRPIGKKELLLWASEVTGLSCSKFEDLRDGVVVLKLISSIWPRAVDPRNARKMKAAPQLEWELKRNWDTIKDTMSEVHLPVHLVDRAAVQQGRFRACYNLLVMLFFMMSLTKHREFSVDFAHPIDPRLSAFLQSSASIDALSRGGALSVQPSDTDEGDDRSHDLTSAEVRSKSAEVSSDDASYGRRHTSAPSTSFSTPLVSHLSLSNEAHASRASFTEPRLPTSLSPSNAITLSSAPDHVAAHRTGGSDLLPATPHQPRASLATLANPRFFSVLEQKVIDLVDNSRSLDAEWHNCVGRDVSSGMSFAAACSCLTSNFPDLCDQDAIRMAFERTAHASDALSAACRDNNPSLSRGDFVDFVLRALYCHSALATVMHNFDPHHRVCAAFESLWASAVGQSSRPGDAAVPEHLFLNAATSLGISGGAGDARRVFKELSRRQNSRESTQGPVSIVDVCDWLVDENSHKFPAFSPYPAHSAATPHSNPFTLPATRSHSAADSGASHIHVSNSITVSANLVSSATTPDCLSQPARASQQSAMATPVSKSYSGAYSATPQSAFAVVDRAPSSLKGSQDDLHPVIDQNSSLDHPLSELSQAAHAAHSAIVGSNSSPPPKDPHSSQNDSVPNRVLQPLPPSTQADSSVARPESPAVRLRWKSVALQEQGEAALAQLKFENESLHRQLQLQQEETALQKSRADLHIEQLRQQTLLEAAVFSSRIGGLEAQLSSAALAHEARLRRELALSASNISDQMRLAQELGSADVQRELGEADLHSVVVALKQQVVQLQNQASAQQRSIAADAAALTSAEASIETERKRVRDLETKVNAALALPSMAPNVSKLINAIVIEHPGGGPLSLRERRLVGIIEAMELEISEMHVAHDAIAEKFSHSHSRNKTCPLCKSKSALESYEDQRELLAMSDKLMRAEEREQYLAAEVAELTRIIDMERAGSSSLKELNTSHCNRQESSPGPDTASPFAWLSQAPGPGEQERLSRNCAVVKALEAAISCIPVNQTEPSSALKSQLKAALTSFWQMEVESLLLRRRLVQTSALIAASADRLHARETLLSQELTACRERNDDAIRQLRDAHHSQCLQLSKQAALYQVQCEIKDIVAQELKMERDAAFAELRKFQGEAFNGSASAFKAVHARLVAISQEAARLRLRDQLWVRLIQVQREAISLSEHQASAANSVAVNSVNSVNSDILKLRQILEHQASVLVNQINSINEAAPPAAAQDIIDVGTAVAEATSSLSALQEATQESLAQARATLDEKRQHIEKVLLDCSQFETMAVHESKRRSLVEEKLNSYVEECAYLRKTLGAAMGAASRDEVLGDVLKIREAEELASQQLLRAPSGSSLDAIIEEDSSFEPSFLLSPKGEGQAGDSNGSHALNGSIEDGIEL